MSTEPVRLLLVEDTLADATLLKHLLAEAQGHSFHVTHVELMSEADTRLSHESFDAILLDLSLPDSSSLGTLAQRHGGGPSPADRGDDRDGRRGPWLWKPSAKAPRTS